MKKQLLFTVLLSLTVAYGQSQVSYIPAGSTTTSGTINDIYVTKNPNSSTDSIYIAVQGTGIQTLRTTFTSANTSIVNTNPNLRISIEDFFNRGKPDLVVSHHISEPAMNHFSFYNDLSSATTLNSQFVEGPAGLLKWRKIFNDTTMYLLFGSSSASNEEFRLFSLENSGLVAYNTLSSGYADVAGEFINTRNLGKIDIISTGVITNTSIGRSELRYNESLGSPIENILDNLGYKNAKIVAGDIDGDGWEDVVVMGEERAGSSIAARTSVTEKITWFKNNGNGAFLKQGNGIVDISDIQNADFALGDFNYDGKIDICVASQGTLKIYLQNTPTTFTEQSVSTGLDDGKHRIGLWTNKLANEKVRLDIFVSSNKKLYRFYQGASSVPEFNLAKPGNLNISNFEDRILQDEDSGREDTLGKDITVAWHKVDKAVSYDGYMEIKSADGNRKKVVLHKSIPLAIHGNLGNGNIEGGSITNIKKAKFFIQQEVYREYANGTATISVWSVDGAYRRSKDSATISIVIPPATPTPPTPEDSICPNCPTDPDNPENIYRRPRVRMDTAIATRVGASTNPTFNVMLKGRLTATGWNAITAAGYYFSDNRDTIENLNFGDNTTTLPNHNTDAGLYRISLQNPGRLSGAIDTTINNITTHYSSIQLAKIYYVRAFAANSNGPILSNRDSIKTFILRPEGTLEPPTPPKTDTLPGIGEEDDDGNIDTIPLPTLQPNDVPLFYKRFPQGYPYQMVNDKISVGSNRVPVRLDFKKVESFSNDDYSEWIDGNRTFVPIPDPNGDSVVLKTRKPLANGHNGLEIPVTARGYDITGDPTRNLKIFSKYSLQQHLVAKKRVFNRDTVILRKGRITVASNNTSSAHRVDTLTILLDPGSTPNQQKTIPLDSFPSVAATYKIIKASFPTVDTSYLDAIPQSQTTYKIDDGIPESRFNIDGNRKLMYLPKDTTFRIEVTNSGNDFFKDLNDSLYVRIITRSHINVDSLPTPPGIDDDEVTVVMPNPDGSVDTVRITGFPTDGVRVFFQNRNNPYSLPTITIPVTVTTSTSDGGIRQVTYYKPIRFSTSQPGGTGLRFSMRGSSILMDSVNTTFLHTAPYTISHKPNQDSVWIETDERPPVGRNKVPIYIIPKQIYDYKVVNTPRHNDAGDEMQIIGDTINILKSITASGSRRFNTTFSFDPTGALNPVIFSTEHKKHLYLNNIHEGKQPTLTVIETGTGNGFSITTDTPQKITATYSDSAVTDSKIRLEGDPITFFKKTNRNLILRVRKFDSIPDNILDDILLRGSVLDWCTSSLSDSIARIGTSSTKYVLTGTTLANRVVRFEVPSEYRHAIELIPVNSGDPQNQDRHIKMLDSGRVIIRAYVNDNGELPALQRMLEFRIVPCPEIIRNTNIDWLKPTGDTTFSTLFRDQFELKAVLTEVPGKKINYQLTDGYDYGQILSGNRLKLQGQIGRLSIEASYEGSALLRPSTKLIHIDIQFIKKRQVIVEKQITPAAFDTYSTIRALSEEDLGPLQYSNFIIKDLIAIRDSLTNIDRTESAKIKGTIEPVAVNGRVIQGFPRDGDPIFNEDTTLFQYRKPVGVPVRLTIWAKEDSLYDESRPYKRNILIIGDKSNPSLILPEYPGKDCFDVKAELKKHYVEEFEYVDIMIYSRYGTNVMNTTAKQGDEMCLQDIQKLPDGVYLCVLYVDGQKSMPYCSYITILRSK